MCDCIYRKFLSSSLTHPRFKKIFETVVTCSTGFSITNSYFFYNYTFSRARVSSKLNEFLSQKLKKKSRWRKKKNYMNKKKKTV